MAYKIAWTKRAIKNYNQVIDYLEAEWSDKVVDNFVKEVQKIELQLAKGNVTYKGFGLNGYYEVPITKHNNLVYRMGAKYIEIIMIYDTRQHPLKKKI